jgi:uncharacterized membrane protein YphA (DoxX/SURF4 family)
MSMNGATRFLPFTGRLLIGGIFLMSGLSKIPAYAGITAAISSVGLPLAPLGCGIALVVTGFADWVKAHEAELRVGGLAQQPLRQ